MKQALAWLGVNGSVVVLLLTGALGGVEWAGNLGRFLVWVLLAVGVLSSGVVAVLMLLAPASREAGKPMLSREDERKIYGKLASLHRRPVWNWADRLFDGVMICLLAAVGWFGTAFGWLCVLALSEVNRASKRAAVRRLHEAAADDVLQEVSR